MPSFRQLSAIATLSGTSITRNAVWFVQRWQGPAGSAGVVSLQGAGATFPNPLYQKWISDYGKLHPNVRIDYQSIGSGGGIKQIQAQTVDFGASTRR